MAFGTWGLSWGIRLLLLFQRGVLLPYSCDIASGESASALFHRMGPYCAVAATSRKGEVVAAGLSYLGSRDGDIALWLELPADVACALLCIWGL